MRGPMVALNDLVGNPRERSANIVGTEHGAYIGGAVVTEIGVATLRCVARLHDLSLQTYGPHRTHLTFERNASPTRPTARRVAGGVTARPTSATLNEWTGAQL